MGQLLFLLIFISNVSSAFDSRLDHLVSNYIFDMTVEWNQRDEVYAEQKLKAFQNEIHILVKQGLNPVEIENRIKKISPTGVSWNGKIKWRERNYLLAILTVSMVIALSYNDNSDPACSAGGNWVELKCDKDGDCYHYFHETC